MFHRLMYQQSHNKVINSVIPKTETCISRLALSQIYKVLKQQQIH